MEKSIKDFLYDFILGGLIIALSGHFIRASKSNVGGFIYGALPIGFVYIYVLAYYTEGIPACSILAKEVVIATAFFVLFVLCAYLLTPRGIWTALLVATVIFLAGCLAYFFYIKPYFLD
jgi:hypothetical protein